MHIPQFPFEIIDWTNTPKEEHKGETGTADWQVINVGKIRVRKLTYSAGYKADHWCRKGHIIHCLEGEMQTALNDGRVMTLKSGETYIVGDDCEAHRTSTENGCVLFVVD
ncbi:MAG: DHCW motif cupin fold protein [Bacteroidota bacterium]